MTCKDCLHYCVCRQTVSDDNWPDTTPPEIKHMFSPAGCENFKLASEYKRLFTDIGKKPLLDLLIYAQYVAVALTSSYLRSTFALNVALI